MEQISFIKVDFGYGQNNIVNNFILDIKAGEIVTFFGPSGCGKSSLMKMVLGINNPIGGKVKIGDIDAHNYKKSISYVPQENELLPWLSVEENVNIWSLNATNAVIPTEKVLEIVNLTEHSKKIPSELSGGMARRTALARGLATNSSIICFDEAMVGIEKTLRHKLLFEIRNFIKEKQFTAIFISHDYEETIFLSDRIIVFSPPPTEILKIIDVNDDGDKRNLDYFSSNSYKSALSQLLT